MILKNCILATLLFLTGCSSSQSLLEHSIRLSTYSGISHSNLTVGDTILVSSGFILGEEMLEIEWRSLDYNSTTNLITGEGTVRDLISRENCYLANLVLVEVVANDSTNGIVEKKLLIKDVVITDKNGFFNFSFRINQEFKVYLMYFGYRSIEFNFDKE